MDRNSKIKSAQEEINTCRSRENCIAHVDHGKVSFEQKIFPGDKTFVPPAEDFITVEWEKGFITIPLDEWRRMPASKRGRILDIPLKEQQR